MIFEMEECGGCRTCELACGYHHTGIFNPSKSSLHVINRGDYQPGFLIHIHLHDEGISLGCDGCIKLEQPLCVKYCHKDEILINMIRTLLSEKSTNSK
jgi:Fe-S-cluster-containing hydrogenase component 2